VTDRRTGFESKRSKREKRIGNRIQRVLGSNNNQLSNRMNEKINKNGREFEIDENPFRSRG
jgi:hypothetical protein